AGLVPPLRDADVAVVNVEMAIAEGGTAQAGKEFTFRAPPSAATTLAAAGIDVGALGNNHAADFGIDALVETVRHLRGAGVRPVGAGRNADEAFAPAVVEVARPGSAPVSVAFVSASGVVPAGFAAADSTPGIASAYEQQRLLDAVTAAAEAHDVVVALLHWGVERAPCPTVSQVALGDALVGAGAHVVVGSHPHVLQPVVERGGGVIAYSLGNFAWHSRSGPQGETGVLEVRFVGDRVDGFSFHPHMLDASGAPVPANAAAAARIESAVERACPVVV
ncbi:MAG TPA: CapA family protein, partial [Acidimicrobiia bacterium]|nr:CapA family protein [Acidimicrobiia bacterium]